MGEPVTGEVHGRTVTLDRDVPDLEGQRVRVVLEPMAEAQVVLSPEAQMEMWRHWIERGPQGPLTVEDEAFP